MKKITFFAFFLTIFIGNAQSIEGTWKMSPQAGAYGVGPTQGSTEWFANSAGDVTTRACYFDDDYVFNADGSFSNVQGAQTWLEGWQGFGDGCNTPVAPHNASNAASWVYDSSAGTLTLNGTGAYLGLPKAYNGGELSNPAAAPASITYLVTTLSATTMVVDISIGGGWWRFNLTKQNVSVTLPLIQNFEAPITYTSLTGFEGASAAVTTDPASGGTNGQVFSGTQTTTGQVYQGIEFVQTTKKAKLTTNKTMQVDVYADQAFNILGKVEVGGPASANGQAYTTPGQWQTLTFDFASPMDGTGPANGEYEKIIFFGNWKATNDGFNASPVAFTYYIDNIRAEDAAITPPPADPTVAAPTPPARPASDVMSLFSDAYTNIAVNEWSTPWDDSNITDLQIEGNATKKITFGNFLGVQLADYQNATDFTHFHMDYYINAGTDLIGKVLNPKLSNHANQTGETSALLLTNLPTVAGSWVSLDVPLTDFAGDPARAAFYQFLITSNIGTVYVDNIYLHKNTLATSSFEASNVKMYPNPANDILNINALSVVEKVSIYNLLGQEVLSKTTNNKLVSINVSGLNSGVYVIKTIVDGKISSSRFIKE